METFKVPIKKIWGLFRQPNWLERQTQKSISFCNDKSKMQRKGLVYSYDFEALEKDLLNTAIPNKPIQVLEALNTSEIPEEGKEKNRCLGKYMRYTKYFNEDYDYIVRDGNHRCYILEKIYGEDHMIECTWAEKQVNDMGLIPKKLRELR
jgi:hypothetical protein